MAGISVNNLTFYYEGSFDNIFENVSFSIDTDWKLGFIGRNGKGKTTFLNLLLGKYEYRGSINTNTVFDYFPYQIKEEYMIKTAAEFIDELKNNCEQWRIICELDKLGLEADILYREYRTLSFGERTKLMLAVLFSGENDFLLIDEPTNHLDQESREIVKIYLKSKKGFILVSHDRDLLDVCIDHVLVLNRCSIEVQSGNFSCWFENKNRKDAFAKMENEKHKKEISKLNEASRRTRQWAQKSESTKIGFDPTKEHDRCLSTRSYIGAKTKKMQSRVKQMESRISQEIEDKEGLLKDIEDIVDLKITPLEHHKKRIIVADRYGIAYICNKKNNKTYEFDTSNCINRGINTADDSDLKKIVFENLSFEIRQGERVFLNGANGCGKSSLIKAVLQKNIGKTNDEKKISSSIAETGELDVVSGLKISYINQDTSFLCGNIKDFCKKRELDESLFCAILRQLDIDRVQFVKNIEEFSEGQKKKVQIAASLLTPAHIYIWDEPLNYIDVFSKIQIEKLLLSYKPTMLIVEHDVRFREQIATKVIYM